eukprot:6447907-Prymnesium_polylepis.3
MAGPRAPVGKPAKVPGCADGVEIREDVGVRGERRPGEVVGDVVFDGSPQCCKARIARIGRIANCLEQQVGLRKGRKGWDVPPGGSDGAAGDVGERDVVELDATRLEVVDLHVLYQHVNVVVAVHSHVAGAFHMAVCDDDVVRRTERRGVVGELRRAHFCFEGLVAQCHNGEETLAKVKLARHLDRVPPKVQDDIVRSNGDGRMEAKPEA